MIIQPTNDWIYQVAMTFYLISYLSNNILVLRFVLAAASVCLFVWSVVTLNIGVDVCIWNGVFFFINVFHGLYLLWQMRPVQFRNEDFKDVYEKAFAAPHSAMSQNEFAHLSSIGYVRELKRGSCYAEQGNKTHSLSILLSGTMDVFTTNDNTLSGKDVLINRIRPFEFIDSPQWITRRRNPNQTFLVTLRAAEDCRYVMWPMEALENLLTKYPQFQTYLDGVVGCDVAAKLLDVDASIGDDSYSLPVPHLQLVPPPLSRTTLTALEALQERDNRRAQPVSNENDNSPTVEGSSLKSGDIELGELLREDERHC